MFNAITDVAGIKVGHYTDKEAATGCTVILCEGPTPCGVDVRGSAPATRETDLLDPTCLVHEVNAIVLSGGSAFGLDAASGVVRYLEERGHGFDAGVAKVPIVPAASLFDLAIGRADVRPTAEDGYRACLAAAGGPVDEGSVGAGTGCTVGKLLGVTSWVKAGLGTASQAIGKGIVVGAIVAVNAFGDIVDPESGKIVAGTRKPVIGGFLNTAKQMGTGIGQAIMGFTNTTIAVVATNAYLNKAQCTKVAQMAHDGMALAIRPVHTMIDGDAVFALATCKARPPFAKILRDTDYADSQRRFWADDADTTIIGTVAAQVLARAIVRAARQATGLRGVPAAAEL